MEKINVLQKFSLFSDHWNPKVIAELNGQQVKIAKVQGEFVWHDHTNEDELFYIIKGSLDLVFRDQTVTINEGEMLVVPKGVEHKPIAQEECWIMLFEPVMTKHTGDVKSEMTVEIYSRI